MKDVRCQVHLNHMFQGKKEKEKCAQVVEAHPYMPVFFSLHVSLVVSNTIRAAVNPKESTPPSSSSRVPQTWGEKKNVAGLNGNAICLPTVYCFLWRPGRLILCDTTNPQLVSAGTHFRPGEEKTKSIILILTLTGRFIKHTLLLLGP